MEKEITAWGMNTWTKKHGLIMFDEIAIGRIKSSISNFIAMEEGYENGNWECIEIKILEKFQQFDAPEILQDDVCFYAGRTFKVRCDYAGKLVAYCFDDVTHIDHLDTAYKLKIVLVKKSK